MPHHQDTTGAQQEIDVVFVEIVAHLVDLWQTTQPIIAVYDDAAWAL
jgi:hypothetical protein